MRTCKYKDINLLFHCWEQYSEVLAPAPYLGGHPGGVVSRVYAIAEDENGQVHRVPAYEITFTDNIFKNYSIGAMK